MELLAFLTHYRVNIVLNILTLFLTIYVPQKLVSLGSISQCTINNFFVC